MRRVPSHAEGGTTLKTAEEKEPALQAACRTYRSCGPPTSANPITGPNSGG
jgi:hypothetical protein